MKRVDLIADRGTGRTTRQLREAPQNSIYIWFNLNLHYVRKLAQHLGRNDIKVMTQDDIGYGRLNGLNVPILVDHAVRLTMQESQEINVRNARFKVK